MNLDLPALFPRVRGSVFPSTLGFDRGILLLIKGIKQGLEPYHGPGKRDDRRI